MSETKSHAAHQQEQMLRSTLWSTIGNFASRFLGLVYVIPWYMWLGSQAAQANALFTMGYNIYGYFLLISSAGIPVAISKQIAKYNSRGEGDLVYPMMRKTLSFMAVVGLILAGIMYLAAPMIASISGGGQELIPVIHSLSWAVLIFPVMSVIRGLFQGFNNLKPFAMSQVAEQIIRVIWMLLFTFMIMKLGTGDYVAAITQSTFAAFVGMLASMAVLAYYLYKEGMIQKLLKGGASDQSLDTTAMLLETLREAVPFIITGSAIQTFQLIDQATFVNSMSWFTKYTSTELQVQFAYFSGNPNKIIMILVAVATSIGGVGIPLLTENFVKRDHQASARLIVNNLTMLAVVLVPAIVGGIVVASPLYTVFYGLPDGLAVGLFIVSLLQTIFLALYTVLSPMIQALFENRRAVRYFGEGVLIKLVIQVPFIFLFQAYGPLLSTIVGLAWPIWKMLQRIHQVTRFKKQTLIKRTLFITILSLLMMLVLGILEVFFALVFPTTGRLSAMIHLFFSVVIGGGVYAYLALWTRLIDLVIGKEKAESFRHKVRIR
ncbi:putative polysaccharide biosynthesis protein [Streptococcus sp. DD13]|uniref:putative polysaccharide biosynthesis protein n=1 Tax=Streptococcus sp. DD13 TaxID=1777881 RepID=UPI000799033F|nr:polysaccharide biosynthesis protein [Streptococcus sp. DD13]KXT78489.1 Membrane protein [Streptococcus sp. DD13]